MSKLTRLLALPALALTLSIAIPGQGFADALQTSVIADTLPEKKQTRPGLYITASEAAAVLAERDDVLLIDVRTPEETLFVGYPTVTDANIPFKLVDPGHDFNAKKNSYKSVANPDFVAAAKAFLNGKDPAAVIVMCRSGSRSAGAVDALAEADIDVPLYSMVDGFEGDKNDAGRRAVNGWKNAGANWTDKIRADLLVTAE